MGVGARAAALMALVALVAGSGCGQVDLGVPSSTTARSSTTSRPAPTTTDGSGPASTGSRPPSTPGSAATADALVPAGSTLRFEAQTVDLEGDGEFMASVVAPETWKSEGGLFGVEWTPPGSPAVGADTTMSADAGCDGICRPTDWEARLRSTQLGYLLDGRTVIDERRPPGSDGISLLTTDSGGALRVLVLRWDDSADRYFECQAALPEKDRDLAPAFRQACEASRPAWFEVV